ncbi:NADP-dependent oxidoreductase [Neorhizobium galegae]|uniref:Alcohol dehydrogenase, zinc-dependent n=1 Tax=Neorhizobium galegae bv. orientalis str. HAMBI 540 TaxID=1028800 RepID=A0A068SW79_NEOGA|nr:NADP-dependent oxidoreductase [Neorhizobium galegae]CDN50021.1 Alcohol dehydrogenase, zinc-dependent [Neorhizobium galegae bv. orientalis str. HAMBI 540]CDZ54842.1 Zn-dependent oxidoreductase, NADPH:quinone reductase [Neorhizobium galegae bv. orientalis]
MKAIQYSEHGPADVMHYIELPDPVAGPGQILVKLEAASVTPFDWKLRAGHLQNHFTLPMPSVPGRDGGGTVISVGDGVTEFVVGDRVAVMAGVFAQGGYAEMIAVDEKHAVKIPDSLSTIDAVALTNAGLSAWIAVRTAEVKSGDKVLVHSGSGAVGGLLVQLCHHLGAHVTATCRSTNRDYVLGLGADRVVAYDEEYFSDILTGQDIVFELMGGEVHDKSYKVLKKGGHMVWLVADPIRDRGEEFGVNVTRAMITDDKSALQGMMDLAGTGLLKPQVARTMPLSEAAEAHRLMEKGAISRGRLMLTM